MSVRGEPDARALSAERRRAKPVLQRSHRGFALKPMLSRQPFFASSFLQSARNFLRSLPCRFCASARLEHSTDAALRGLVAALAPGVEVVAWAYAVPSDSGAARRPMMKSLRMSRTFLCGVRIAAMKAASTSRLNAP